MFFLYQYFFCPYKKKLKRVYCWVRNAGLRLSEAFGLKGAQRFLIYPDSFGLVLVNPQLITDCLMREVDYKSFVWKGNWDVDAIAPLSRARPEVYSAVYDIFVNNKSYTLTRQYREMIYAVDLYLLGKTDNPAAFGAYWCRSHEDVGEYFGKLIRAYHSIKEEGYRSQKEIALMRPDDSRGESDEIQIVIGRFGELILANGGTHRTLIAKILSIPTVPVRIMAVHEQFLVDECGGTRRLRNALNERLRELARSNQAELAKRSSYSTVSNVSSIQS